MPVNAVRLITRSIQRPRCNAARVPKVKANKVDKQPKAPAGWYYMDPVHKTWVYPAVGSQDAKIFDQLWAAKIMRESTLEEDVSNYNNWIRYTPQILSWILWNTRKKKTAMALLCSL